MFAHQAGEHGASDRKPGRYPGRSDLAGATRARRLRPLGGGDGDHRCSRPQPQPRKGTPHECNSNTLNGNGAEPARSRVGITEGVKSAPLLRSWL